VLSRTHPAGNGTDPILHITPSHGGITSLKTPLDSEILGSRWQWIVGWERKRDRYMAMGMCRGANSIVAKRVQLICVHIAVASQLVQ